MSGKKQNQYNDLILSEIRALSRERKLFSAEGLTEELEKSGINIDTYQVARTIDNLERRGKIGAAYNKEGKPGERFYYYLTELGQKLEEQGILSPEYEFPSYEAIKFTQNLGKKGRAAAVGEGRSIYWLEIDEWFRTRRRERE